MECFIAADDDDGDVTAKILYVQQYPVSAVFYVFGEKHLVPLFQMTTAACAVFLQQTRGLCV